MQHRLKRVDGSSTIAGYRYDIGSQQLYVGFVRGEIYRYDAVPGEVVNGLDDADSKGTYFSAHIRRSFNFQHLVDDTFELVDFDALLRVERTTHLTPDEARRRFPFLLAF
jgi:hypothetical protein